VIEYTIYCDSCGEMIDVQPGSARQARRRAKKKGVLVRVLRKDYCPRCAEKLHGEGEIDAQIRSQNRD
jgi:predicted transcriptional regulator of viral defense system